MKEEINVKNIQLAINLPVVVVTGAVVLAVVVAKRVVVVATELTVDVKVLLIGVVVVEVVVGPGIIQISNHGS